MIGPISGILFDKDGTLLDYALSWLPVNRAMAEFASGGDPVLARHLLETGGMDPASGHVKPDSLLAAGTASEIARGMADQGAVHDHSTLTVEFDRMFAEGAQYAVPVTDLLALFQKLKMRGLKLGIASSDNEASIRATVERFGILHLVDFIAGYDSGYGSKPDPGMIFGFCAATGLKPHDIAMVGDNNHDMQMGRTAGAGRTVGVLTGTGSRQSLAALADHVIPDITTLEDLLV
jgi:phosphoglycolate phosphatase